MEPGNEAIKTSAAVNSFSYNVVSRSMFTLSSPIMISSISLQLPSFTPSGLSNVDTISPPAVDDRVGCNNDLIMK